MKLRLLYSNQIELCSQVSNWQWVHLELDSGLATIMSLTDVTFIIIAYAKDCTRYLVPSEPQDQIENI